MVTDKLITASVKDFAQDKDYLNAFIVALASKWSIDEPIVISTADAESLKNILQLMQKLYWIKVLLSSK